MEKIYSEQNNACELVETGQDTVRFLLDFSKSLKITGYKRFKFETNLN